MNLTIPLYPLKFQPILKKKVWGGTKLKEMLGKDAKSKIGESWEISGVKDNISIVNEGPLSGKTLDDLLKTYKEDLVGEQVYQKFGNTFPLLFKYIDADKNLSVQVHPDDQLAKNRHNSFGKSEMWYILDAEKNSQIIIGFKEGIARPDYLQALVKGDIVKVLNFKEVQSGDTFVINPGTVHAIGAGILLAEIQQTSDITYRIYDWDRRDEKGNIRELHTDLALDALSFDPSVQVSSKLNHNSNSTFLGGTEFFQVNKLSFSKPSSCDLKGIDSFKVYMCIEGRAKLQGDDFSVAIRRGETVLVPACIGQISFETDAATFLEAFVP